MRNIVVVTVTPSCVFHAAAVDIRVCVCEIESKSTSLSDSMSSQPVLRISIRGLEGHSLARLC